MNFCENLISRDVIEGIEIMCSKFFRKIRFLAGCSGIWILEYVVNPVQKIFYRGTPCIHPVRKKNILKHVAKRTVGNGGMFKQQGLDASGASVVDQ